jgi:hypothetical protein
MVLGASKPLPPKGGSLRQQALRPLNGGAELVGLGLTRVLSPREATPIPLPPKGGSPPEVEYGLLKRASP